MKMRDTRVVKNSKAMLSAKARLNLCRIPVLSFLFVCVVHNGVRLKTFDQSECHHLLVARRNLALLEVRGMAIGIPSQKQS